ncbi:MAG: aldo/keto reductase [Deltaproteobacteria bacterium]|nr:aldo/keto reductase [Deltaproteobacteria bacterium]
MSVLLNSKVNLNDGNEMPSIGLGTYSALGKEAVKAVTWAIEAGYRLIDTATFYGNEKEIGDAIEKSLVNRSDLFVTSKVWQTDHGKIKPFAAIEKSLSLLKTDYLDLYLIHWPSPGTRLETWKTLTKIVEKGLTKSIGVSNFTIEHLEELKSVSGVIPAINQIEFHPFQFESELLEYCNERSIVVQAHTPLVRCRKNEIPELVRLEEKYGKTPAQILLRWCIQHGTIPLPKSSNKDRINENIQIFDFEMDNGDMDLLNNINDKYRVVEWNPNDIEWR